jgi:hypothetical protein
MTERKELSCTFIRGMDDYINTDVTPLKISRLASGGTKVVAHVAHASGEWIRSGEAFQTPEGIELVYQTFSDGEIAFELYGCELQFIFEELPFDNQLRFTLKNTFNNEEPADDLKII